jgi:arginase
MDHIIKYGIGEVITKSLHYLDPECKYPFHISFDLDVVDPYLVNQTGTLYRDGITHREACHIIRRVVN